VLTHSRKFATQARTMNRTIDAVLGNNEQKPVSRYKTLKYRIERKRLHLHTKFAHPWFTHLLSLTPKKCDEQKTSNFSREVRAPCRQTQRSDSGGPCHSFSQEGVRIRLQFHPVVKFLSRRWWIPIGARIEGPKLDPEQPRSRGGIPTAYLGFSSIQGAMFGLYGITVNSV